jgi:hypothetical protein
MTLDEALDDAIVAMRGAGAPPALDVPPMIELGPEANPPSAVSQAPLTERTVEYDPTGRARERYDMGMISFDEIRKMWAERAEEESELVASRVTYTTIPPPDHELGKLRARFRDAHTRGDNRKAELFWRQIQEVEYKLLREERERLRLMIFDSSVWTGR